MITTTTRSASHGVKVLVVQGELDISSSPDFEQALRELESEANTVVIDLSGLSFLDSTGLRAIVQCDSRLQSAGKKLQLVPGSGPVRRVFRLTGLDSRLEFIEEATGLSDDVSGDTLDG